mgnify:CR=1 FL=1
MFFTDSAPPAESMTTLPAGPTVYVVSVAATCVDCGVMVFGVGLSVRIAVPPPAAAPAASTTRLHSKAPTISHSGVRSGLPRGCTAEAAFLAWRL